ncbi:MAG: DUF5682 family protein [Myxococcales bacterium]|nr:DUF5682 family protein [Polyangiaceae bacterium]MDW8248062.1 DUF5682 family protein [Myxococcales bacterium]
MANRRTAVQVPSVEHLKEGTMGHVFGIRHLSPGGAWHLERLLEQVDPTAVLIEGPSDASPLIEHFLHEKTRPPIAILAFTCSPPIRSILFPLAAYSPEWVAATWAVRNRRLVRFMDLPASLFLGLEPTLTRQEDSTAPTTDTQRYLDDPWQEIARITGDPHYEIWWERQFEQLTAEGAYREAIHELGKGLRSLRKETGEELPKTLMREAFMRREIRRAVVEGHAPERLVVVCGAYHVPALRWELPPMDDAQLSSLVSSPVQVALMPYSYRRLSSQSGYGAGNHAPAYYQALWEEIAAGTPGRLPARYLTEVAGKLREAGMIRSSAEVIEAVRLASTLAALRQDRVAPTLAELRDAAITLLGRGDQDSIARYLDAVEIGDVIGAVPPGVAQTAIQKDFHRWIKDLGLSEYLKDREQIVRGRASKRQALDLREDRFAKSKEAAFRDRRVAVFLRRIEVLDIGFARYVTTEDDRSENTFKERWIARWTPDCEVRLAECSLLGDSIELAATRRLLERLALATDTAEISEIVQQGRRCALPSVFHEALQYLQQQAVSDSSFLSIARSTRLLAGMSRFQEVDDIDASPALPLVAQLFLRAVMLVVPAARCDDGAAVAVGRAMADVAYVALLGDLGEALPVDRWRQALHAVAEDDLVHPFVAGVACALLLEAGALDDESLDRRIVRQISPGMDPSRCAGFFEGLASRNRMVLLSRHILWSSLSTFLEQLDDGAFLRALPGLRRAFASFSLGEIRRVADILTELWGEGGSALVQAIETCLDDDEVRQLQEELGNLDL